MKSEGYVTLGSVSLLPESLWGEEEEEEEEEDFLTFQMELLFQYHNNIYKIKIQSFI